jgi:uncharacterized protein (TIGR02246 family)
VVVVDSTIITPADAAAIRGLLDRMGDAWARGDGAAYASVFSDDARYVNAPGTRLVGRRAIADAHQKIFDSFFKDTRLGGYPAELQPVTPDVVLVHAGGAVLFAGEREQDVAPNGLVTMVAARDHGPWQFVSFSNTPTGRARAASFLRRYVMARARRVRTGTGRREPASGSATEPVEQWMATYGRHATGGYEWVGRGHLDADLDEVTAVLLGVRPGPVGAGNAVMLDTGFWSRLVLAGGPRRYVGRLGEATVLVEIDPDHRSFALQGRLGWRIVTHLEPAGTGTTVVRRVQHLSRAKRAFVPLLQRTRFGLRGDLRRLDRAVRQSALAVRFG